MRMAMPLLLVVLAAHPAAAQAPDALDAAKSLYAAASYEEALALLGTDVGGEAAHYRALCLFALGRSSEARLAIEAFVKAAPTLAAPAEDVPPRYAALFADTRRQLLPALMREAFTEGRDRYQAGEHAEAVRSFRLAADLAADPQLEEDQDASDILLLAEGFIELAEGAEPAEPPPAAAVTPAPPPRTGLVMATAIRQFIPPWPLAAGTPTRGTTGAIRVQIGADGRVKQARIEVSTHPRYDQLLLTAARSWEYTPATLNGDPIAIEKVVSYSLSQ